LHCASHSRRVALFVIHYPGFGGPHNRVLRIAPKLALAGWDCVVVLPTENGNAVSWLRSAGVRVIETPLGRVRRSRDPLANIRMLASAPREIATLRGIMRDVNADMVIVGNLVMPHGAIAARFERLPILWQIVDTAVPRMLQRVVMPLVRRWADAVLYGGATLRSAHVGSETLEQPWFVIPPPVDCERFKADQTSRQQVREELGIASHIPVVGQVAALNPKKGLEYFLQGMPLVLAVHPDARFVIVGSAHSAHQGYYRELHDLQKSLGLGDEQVMWLGDKADAERYYAAMDVFAVTSRPNSEGTTTTSMEALACEVPVVATDVGAVAEVVEDGVCGYLVPPDDPSAFAQRVNVLLSGRQTRRDFGEAGRRRAFARFDTSVCVDRYLEAFEGAIAHSEAKFGSQVG
jgi:glycosyltransferase involved in cell wall biosynthesis